MYRRVLEKLNFLMAKDAYEVAKIWRSRGVIVGENTAIYKTVRFGNGGKDPVVIGDNCVLTGCTILGHDASFNRELGIGKGQMSPTKQVTIEDDCFIGFGAIITMGVTIGKGSIVGAGAIVRSDVEADSIMVGNPAVRIGSVKEVAEKKRKQYL